MKNNSKKIVLDLGDKDVSFGTLFERSHKLIKSNHRVNAEVMHAAAPNHELKLPPMITSALCRNKENDLQHHIFLDVYGNYNAAYEEVSRVVDDIISNIADSASPYELTTLLLKVMAEKGFSQRRVFEFLADMILHTSRFTKELFRYAAIGLLIMPELREVDKEGTAIHNTMNRLKQAYCDTLEPETRAEILADIGLTDNEIEYYAPVQRLVDDIVSWPLYPRDHPTLPGMANYKLSPYINVGLFEGQLMGQNRPGIAIKATKRAVFTRIFDFAHDPTSCKAISSAEELDRLVYKKNDAYDGIQNMFQLQQRLTLATPVVCWSSEKKRGTFRFKAIELRVFDKQPIKQKAKIDEEEVVVVAPATKIDKETVLVMISGLCALFVALFYMLFY